MSTLTLAVIIILVVLVFAYMNGYLDKYLNKSTPVAGPGNGPEISLPPVETPPPPPPKPRGPTTWMAKRGYVAGTGGVYNFECPAGSYVSAINGYGGDFVNAAGVECSNGTKFGPYGNKTGTPRSEASPPGGFSQVSGKAGWWNNTLLGIGNPNTGGAPYTDICPEGQYITGMEVDTDGNLVGGLRFGCNTI